MRNFLTDLGVRAVSNRASQWSSKERNQNMKLKEWHTKRGKKKNAKMVGLEKQNVLRLAVPLEAKRKRSFLASIIKLIVLKSTNSSHLFKLKCNVKHGKWPIQIANTNTTMGDLKQQPESTDRPSLKAFIANATTEIRGSVSRYGVRKIESRWPCTSVKLSNKGRPTHIQVRG